MTWCWNERDHQRQAERDFDRGRKDRDMYDRHTWDGCKEAYTKEYDRLQHEAERREDQRRREEEAEHRRQAERDEYHRQQRMADEYAREQEYYEQQRIDEEAAAEYSAQMATDADESK